MAICLQKEKPLLGSIWGVCVCVCVCVCILWYIDAKINIYTNVYIYIYTKIYMCMYICILWYVNIYIHTYIHTHTKLICICKCVRVSLVAQMVKNPSAMRETWVQSLGREDSLEEGMATHYSILSWRIPMDKGAWQAIVHGVSKSQTRLSN